jgi:uncharacterized Zn-binding protein involved in type VI secretion
MPGVQRMGDPNNAGGLIISGHMNVKADGRPFAKFMSPVTPHPCCGVKGCTIHCTAKGAFPGSMKVTVNGLPVVKDNDKDTCGHSRMSGSRKVQVT